MSRAIDVARFIINYANKHLNGMSSLKLHKILYFAQAHCLMMKGKNSPCFADKIEAWRHGPVVPDVYDAFKQYGSMPIPSITSYVERKPGKVFSYHEVPFDESIIPEEDRKLIIEVMEEFQDWHAFELVDLTHEQDPWKNAIHRGRNAEITTDAIYNYYKGFYEQSQ